MKPEDLLKEIQNQTVILRNARGETAKIINEYNEALKGARLVESLAFERLSALISIASK